jgi:uncharacterized protein DUF1841
VLFAGTERDELRRRYVEAWRRRLAGLPLEPLDAAIADVIELHPEYQALLESPENLQRAFTIDGGETNPFLHMGLHLALREQLATSRPQGIVAIHGRLRRKLGEHAAEHAMIEVLAATLWEAQRAGRAPDEGAYLQRLQSL